MRTSAVGGIVVGMDGELTRLTVELESGSEPIAGRVGESGGTAYEFAGYMSLIEALERLRRSPKSPPNASTRERPLPNAR